MNELLKGKKLPEGTIREWAGSKYQKVGGKWKPYSEGKGGLLDENKFDANNKLAYEGLKKIGHNFTNKPFNPDLDYTGEWNKEKPNLHHHNEDKSTKAPNLKAVGKNVRDILASIALEVDDEGMEDWLRSDSTNLSEALDEFDSEGMDTYDMVESISEKMSKKDLDALKSHFGNDPDFSKQIASAKNFEELVDTIQEITGRSSSSEAIEIISDAIKW